MSRRVAPPHFQNLAASLYTARGKSSGVPSGLLSPKWTACSSGRELFGAKSWQPLLAKRLTIPLSTTIPRLLQHNMVLSAYNHPSREQHDASSYHFGYETPDELPMQGMSKLAKY